MLFAFLPEAAWKSSKSELAAWVETLWGRKKKALDKGKGKERKVMSLSHVQLCDPMGYSLYQDPLSMGFSRQEYWSGLPFPSPRQR